MHLLALGAAPVAWVSGASFNIPTEPRISLIRSNNGVVRLTYQGQTNYQYILRASTNLQNWVNLTTNVPLTSPTSFTDNAATNSPRRFYSAVAFKSSMFYDGVFADENDTWSYLLYVRTNNTGILLGRNDSRHIGESRTNLLFDPAGICCGQLLSFASGCLTNSPWVATGTYTNLNNTNSTGNFRLFSRMNAGSFRNAAGFYSGHYEGSCSGTAQALVTADGLAVFYLGDGTTYSDAWIGLLNASGKTPFGFPVAGTLFVSATLNLAAFTITGTYTNACADRIGTGTFQLSIVDHAY
jgi:hypothetical protein